MATFTWIPAKANLQEHARVNSSKFGDGYEQRRPAGINAISQQWSLFLSVKTSPSHKRY